MFFHKVIAPVLLLQHYTPYFNIYLVLNFGLIINVQMLVCDHSKNYTKINIKVNKFIKKAIIKNNKQSRPLRQRAVI
jgi:hypothetical protein